MRSYEKTTGPVLGLYTWVTLAGEASGHVDAGPVAADAVHDGALVDVDAPHVVLVQNVALFKKVSILYS